MSRIILFGEKDYIYRMETVVRDFLKKNVRHGYFRSYDNARIHYYAIKHENEKGVIVISHGFCDFSTNTMRCLIIFMNLDIQYILLTTEDMDIHKG